MNRAFALCLFACALAGCGGAAETPRTANDVEPSESSSEVSPIAVASDTSAGGTTRTLPPGVKATKPTWVTPPDVYYTKEAYEAGIEGTIIARCIIEVDGTVGPCTIVRGLPGLDEAALEGLRHAKMTPGIIDGVPRRVQLFLPLRVRLPPEKPVHRAIRR